MQIKTKKGDVTDMLIFLVAIIVLAIGLFIFAYIIPQISDGLRGAGMNSSTEGEGAISSLNNFGTVTIQRGFFLLMVGLIISTMITSFLTRTHPIFIFIYILFLAVTIFVGTYLGNMYETFANNPVFADTLASQTIINAVMTNLIKIIIGVGALSIIIVFSKFSSFGRSAEPI